VEPVLRLPPASASLLPMGRTQSRIVADGWASAGSAVHPATLH
jgi:hypothetical protein